MKRTKKTKIKFLNEQIEAILAKEREGCGYHEMLILLERKEKLETELHKLIKEK